MSLIGIIVFLIILGVIFWAVRSLSGAFGIPAPIVTVIYVLLVVFACLYLLSSLGYIGGLGNVRLGR
jgi:uncharacterized membrane protein YwzB